MLAQLLSKIILFFSALLTPISGQSSSLNISVTPTPSLPFQELTIPYLRTQTFDSRLSDLKKQSENNSYISYITSYQSNEYAVNGLLTIPKGESPTGGWPAVVFVHGYIPPKDYRTLSSYQSFIDYPAKKGLVVFKIDLRGHDRSEGEPGGSYYSPDYVIDTLNAYSALQKADFVNPQQIGLWGHSMAGNIVLRAVAINMNIPKAVIWAGAGYTYEDIQTYRISDTSYRPPPSDSPQQIYRQELVNTHGAFNPSSDFWQQVPATNYLEGVATKLQLHHARNDSVVSIDYSRNLSQILHSAGLESELFEYESGGHNLSGSTFTTALQTTVDFFQK